MLRSVKEIDFEAQQFMKCPQSAALLCVCFVPGFQICEYLQKETLSMRVGITTFYITQTVITVMVDFLLNTAGDG
jgi:hypothetical protein